MISIFKANVLKKFFYETFCSVFAFIYFLVICFKISFFCIWSSSCYDFYYRFEVFYNFVFTNQHFGFLSRLVLSKIGLIIVLTICASSYNVNIQLSPFFITSINFILVFASRMCTCAYYAFFQPIFIAALAFMTNSIIFYINRSRSGILILFYLFDSPSKSKPISNKPLCLNLIIDSDNYC